MTTETIYIVKGEVQEYQTEAGEVWEGATDGQPEWQFSDGPAGSRGSSADYLDLRRGLEEHRECGFNIDEADFTPEEAAIFADFIKSL